MTNYDIAIIGAGPAGMACALSFARYNLKIALIEKRPFPLSKPCGESILPVGIEHLKSLNIFAYLDTHDYHTIKGIHYITKNASAKADFFSGVGIGIDRATLSNAFYKAVIKHKNITIIQGEFKNFSRGIIFLNNSLQIRTNFLVGADGLRSSVRRVLGFQQRTPLFKRYALTTHITIKPWSSLVEIYLQNGVEAYVTPTGPQQITVVLLWSKTDIITVKGKDIFSSLINQFPELNKKLHNHQNSYKPVATGPFHHRVQHMHHGNNAVLISDAAGYIDPLTGEGISIGMHQGQLLARMIGPELGQNKEIKRTLLKRFEREARSHTCPHNLLTYGLLIAQKFPAFFDKALIFFDRYPQFLSALTALSMGKRGGEIIRNFTTPKNFSAKPSKSSL